MSTARIEILYRLCSEGTATQEERWEFIALLNDPEHAVTAHGLVKESVATASGELIYDPATLDAMAQAIVHSDLAMKDTGQAGLNSANQIFSIKKAWLRYAAVLLLTAGTAAFLYLNNRPQKEIAKLQSAPHQNDVLPGSDKAILTTADGRKIQLDSTANKILAQMGIANNNALISYSDTIAANAINTLTTPRGGQYKIKLSDGTMVWLNAASSITYPTVFTGSQRTVKITGEAYMEVAKDHSKPFMVQVGKMNVEVLGTHFNINAYPDEATIQTTLLEGSVRIIESGKSAILSPGQQASVNNASPGERGINIVRNADIDKIMAWKNGLFNFQDVKLEEVMRQLSRWYQIDVIYEKGIPDLVFVGEMSRNISLSGVLKGLQGAGVHFRIEEGRRLVVLR